MSVINTSCLQIYSSLLSNIFPRLEASFIHYINICSRYWPKCDHVLKRIDRDTGTFWYRIPQGAHFMVCNRSWHLPGNPKLVWHPAHFINEGRCVDLSMETLHLNYTLVLFRSEGSALTLHLFLPKVATNSGALGKSIACSVYFFIHLKLHTCGTGFLFSIGIHQ